MTNIIIPPLVLFFAFAGIETKCAPKNSTPCTKERAFASWLYVLCAKHAQTILELKKRDLVPHNKLKWRNLWRIFCRSLLNHKTSTK